ncbi:SDR family NAD(P)-dependent oxidoreductase [Streptomyces chengbuensis]|nr:SDR family NAD(P)-dependent oxidoreductase [Streptomyces sp. HUAS CB01]WJY54021.1 SDR family NAD(P)-dependent oxidoreductase [Streptomyces sp. HUAS CB01]
MTRSTATPFADRVAVVTGAGSGTGRATAVALAQAGARILGAGRRKEALEETARAHPGIAVLPLDIVEEGPPKGRRHRRGTLRPARSPREQRRLHLRDAAGGDRPLGDRPAPRTQRDGTEPARPRGTAAPPRDLGSIVNVPSA